MSANVSHYLSVSARTKFKARAITLILVGAFAWTLAERVLPYKPSVRIKKDPARRLTLTSGAFVLEDWRTTCPKCGVNLFPLEVNRLESLLVYQDGQVMGYVGLA